MNANRISYYVEWKGGSKLVNGWGRAKALAVKRSTELGFADIRQTTLDGYRKLAVYRNGQMEAIGGK